MTAAPETTLDAAPRGALPRIATLSERRRAVFGAAIGTTIEWYDFLLYASAAALVFNRVFFPKADPLTGAMLAFTTYALGFLARPLGAVVFGHFGDRTGRKKLLMASLMLMGGSTFAIGLLPTYAGAGMLAPILLTFMRLLQGIGVGGEWGGAMLMAAEYAEAPRRGFWCGVVQAGGAVGNLLATAILAGFAAGLSEHDFLAWGWRIPFLFSAALIVVGLWLRSAVAESPVFEAALEEAEGAHAAPIVQVLKTKGSRVALGACLKLAENISYYVVTAFAMTYLTEVLHLPRSVALNGVLAGGVAGAASMPLWAALSDRVGRRPVYIAGAVGLSLWVFAFFPLVRTGSPLVIAGATFLAVLIHSAMNGPQGAFIAELFPTRVRYSGASLCYQLPAIVGGSFAPIIAIGLLKATGSTVPISAYVATACAISFVAALLARETKGKTFSEIDAAG
ncbi:MFS transporter [Phenylobacterium soli]|uniref:MFS transporter n=1 Tax=Phenylobacterium soli TaxID=2170551 RepID=A0A328AGT6_9CAUL|nr:MFS transporter [Phenylobacterium soli]RAK53849.1 MFS transporter [Phenylobacterium soli]